MNTQIISQRLQTQIWHVTNIRGSALGGISLSYKTRKARTKLLYTLYTGNAAESLTRSNIFNTKN